jgi:GTPase SAR1 family protein
MSKSNPSKRTKEKINNIQSENINNITQIKIIIIGKSGSGKTSFVNRWVNDTFSDIYKSTIVSEYSSKMCKYNNNFVFSHHETLIIGHNQDRSHHTAAFPAGSYNILGITHLPLFRPQGVQWPRHLQSL